MASRVSSKEKKKKKKKGQKKGWITTKMIHTPYMCIFIYLFTFQVLLFEAIYKWRTSQDVHKNLTEQYSIRYSIAENEIRKQTRTSERLYTIFQVF